MKIDINCKHCKKKYSLYVCQTKNGRGVFCSRSCAAKYNFSNQKEAIDKGRDAVKAKGIALGGRPKSRVAGSCQVCGKLFEVPASQKRRKYCSTSCYIKNRPNYPVRIGHKNPLIAGANHYNWKGGVTSENERIRHSREYKDWRTAVFQRDKYSCVQCGLKPGSGKRHSLQADHIKPFSLYPELRFDISNGRTMCAECHRKTPTYGMNAEYMINKKAS